MSAPHGSSHIIRKGAASVANAIGAPLARIRHMGGRAPKYDVILDYIDPNVLPSPSAWFFFGLIAPLRHLFQVRLDSATVALRAGASYMTWRCNLHNYALSREAEYFKWTEFYVDKFDAFHAKNHVHCSCNYSSVELKNRSSVLLLVGGA
eukprot:jgi/Tetstr1/429443/TSEL_019353.t1